jgi:hypothetical protein
MSDEWKAKLPASGRIEVELMGGPRDGERRAIEADKLFATMVFVSSPRGTMPATEWTEVGAERHLYRAALTPDEVAASSEIVAGVRFYYAWPKRKQAA